MYNMIANAVNTLLSTNAPTYLRLLGFTHMYSVTMMGIMYMGLAILVVGMLIAMPAKISDKRFDTGFGIMIMGLLCFVFVLCFTTWARYMHLA